MEKIKDETDADSLVEVIRRSLAVYESLIKAQGDGASIIIRNGKKEQELLLVP